MADTVKVTVLTGPPGCGKTTQFLAEMAQTPGRYLFCMPRNDLIEERVRDLHERASTVGTAPIIMPIHSDQGSRIPVLRRVTDAAVEFTAEPHVMVLISHEALMSADLSGYEGWAVRVDEVPDAVCSGTFRIPSSWKLFAAAYGLNPVEGSKWSSIRVLDDAHTTRDLMKDDIVGDLAKLHKKAISPQGVFVDLYEWSDAQSRREVRWCSVWTLYELARFSDVKMAASGFFSSLCCLATKALHPNEVVFEEEVVLAGRTAWPNVRVHYYTRGHRASTGWWASPEGRQCLGKVGLHLASVHLGFWSGNEMVRDRLEIILQGNLTLPKQAGTNSLRHHTSCALIYSNKAQRGDDAVLEVLGVTRGQIERARQMEDIEQFIMRGAIRQNDFGGIYSIHVYDVWQAEAMGEFLAAQGINDVELVAVEEAGIMDVQRPRPGPKARQPDPLLVAKRKEDQRRADAERKRRTREQEREAKRAAGTLRTRGRPRK